MWASARSFYSLSRSYSFRSFASRKDYAITLTDDGTTFVALHPEPKVAYEDSLPLPPERIAKETASPLVSSWPEAMRAVGLCRDEPPEAAIARLAQLTMTTKHLWYPRSRDKKIRRIPSDRPYL